NHHIYLKEDKHYYSVPFQLTGKKVLVTYTSRNVEVYFNNRRVALHTRKPAKYRYTTKDEHRPSGHKFVAEWTPRRFINWAAKIGPEVQEFVTALLDSRKHPEQAYKSCMGLLSLAKKHEPDDFIKACKKALALNCLQYKFVKNVLQNKAFDMSGEEQMELFRISEHENLRGKGHFN
ncbi:MAG: IS21 family transposase, partial [Bacteroidota bacterium]|nr:IS21 family transposase [Bacteroidota bacterium]